MGTPVNFASHLAWPLGVALAILLAVLVAFLFVRRGYRHQYFRRLDEAREECEPVLEGLFSGSARYEEGLASLRALSGRRPSGYLETLLLADKNPPVERTAILARLCEDLGLVAKWQQRLSNGKVKCGVNPDQGARYLRGFLRCMRPLSFVSCAGAAENLGTVRHRPSWPLLVEALGNSHPSVRSVAARALGRIQELESFPALVERLESSAAEPVPGISLRSLKMALMSFPGGRRSAPSSDARESSTGERGFSWRTWFRGWLPEAHLLRFLLSFVLLSLAYAGLLSFGAVVMEELTHCRYPSARHLAILLALFPGLSRVGKGGARRRPGTGDDLIGNRAMITPEIVSARSLRRFALAFSCSPSRSPVGPCGQSRLAALVMLVAIVVLTAAGLSRADPGGPQSTGGATQAEHRAEPAAAEPAPTSVPAERIAYYHQRLQANPGDTDALEGLARAEAELKNFPAAISAYRRVLADHPRDRSAQIQLARLLGWNQQYDDSIRAFRAVLDEAPDDREALEGLANVQMWSKRLEDAAVTFGHLASRYPDDPRYLFKAASLEADTHQYAAARERLTNLLAVQPGNLDALLMLGQLELKQGQYTSALGQFQRVLAERPADIEALMGAARAHYYAGNFEQSYLEANQVVEKQPENFDALFLLATIERARGHRHQARQVLNRAERVAPHTADVKDLREKLWNESSTVLHLSTGYAREIGSPANPGVPAEAITEDLRSFSFGSRLDFTALPHSTSSFSFYSLPVQMPSGFFGGAAAPLQFLYQQTTRVSSKLILRGGAGLEHFGPGEPVNLPNGAGPQPSATTTPIGFGGGTFVLNPRFSFDLIWNRSGITYTPLCTRLGVVSNRIEGGAAVTFDPRTNLQLTYWREHLATQPYGHLVTVVGPSGSQETTVESSEHENGSGGTLTFNHRFLERDGLAVEAGASALLLGYDGPRRGVFLGFFTPSFYQRELATGRLSGQFTKRLGYDISAGFGLQQIDQGTPIKHALNASPALTFKLTPYLSGSIGYVYYDSAQSLGLVQGNGVHLGLDWRF